ncbi:MAG: chorismate-binding protein, partial [Gammaproteobacteria bacterium]|nr:chorismate-binding protein [Gammaproteobacteria bacterium]
MDSKQFETLAAQGYNRIPVVCDVLADLETPLSVYLKLADGPYSYLFESVQGGEKWGRYSIIGLPASRIYKISGSSVVLAENGKIISEESVEDPISFIDSLQSQFNVAELDGLPRFFGGLVGYFGYDTVRYIEPKLKNCPNPDLIGAPDILLMVSDEVVVFDNLSGRMFVVVHAEPERGDTFESCQNRLNDIIDQMHQPLERIDQVECRLVDEADFVSGFTEQGFKQAVERIKEYILEGDCMQVVLSQRLSIPYTSRPLDLYRALRGLNPSPYMYFLNLDDFQIVGSSPEILVRLEDDTVTVRPIAGTRRRGYTEQEDLAMEEELLADPKELAEHLMLIDLGRNDTGRVAEIGSVKL